MIEKAMQYAKNPVEEKIGFSFQIPVSMKQEFERVCKLNGVTMTNMLLGLIKATNEEYPDYSKYDPSRLLDLQFIQRGEVEYMEKTIHTLSDNNIALMGEQYDTFYNAYEKEKLKLKRIEDKLDEQNILYRKYGMSEKEYSEKFEKNMKEKEKKQ
ncbi:MAG: hypothetical protein JXR48_01565 [Candidatus Delongbacteria bacterium]|nr:hypothetical protein [Candidatus Delongbacteria bacterium]